MEDLQEQKLHLEEEMDENVIDLLPFKWNIS